MLNLAVWYGFLLNWKQQPLKDNQRMDELYICTICKSLHIWSWICNGKSKATSRQPCTFLHALVLHCLRKRYWTKYLQLKLLDRQCEWDSCDLFKPLTAHSVNSWVTPSVNCICSKQLSIFLIIWLQYFCLRLKALTTNSVNRWVTPSLQFTVITSLVLIMMRNNEMFSVAKVVFWLTQF